jgi:nucleoside-diphosphate-sugar epimerase
VETDLIVLNISAQSHVVLSNMKKIGITGCNGIVGKRVVMLALIRGYTVVGIDIKPLDDVLAGYIQCLEPAVQNKFLYVQADLKDYNQALKVLEGCQGVVHLSVVYHDFTVNTHNAYVMIFQH